MRVVMLTNAVGGADNVGGLESYVGDELSAAARAPGRPRSPWLRQGEKPH